MDTEHRKKNLILIGQFGMGKSSTGNTLLKDTFEVAFSVGHQAKPKTAKMELKSSEKYNIIDCPGFGDSEDPYRFFKNYINQESIVSNIIPINGILLVTKFTDGVSNSLLNAAQDFYSIFGNDGLKCLVILCIKINDKSTLSDDEFKKKLYDSNGYKYLSEKKSHTNIPFCVWDNNNPLKNQEANLNERLNSLEIFDLRALKFSIQNVENKIKILQLEENLKQLKDQQSTKENGWCSFL